MLRRRQYAETDDRGVKTGKTARFASYAIGGLALAIVTFTSIYTVDASQQAITRRFGAYVETQQPGYRTKLPWPVESRKSINTEQVRTLAIGYRTVVDEKTGKIITENKPEEIVMMTGDENLAWGEFTVQWDIKDPFAYAFHVKDPEKTLHDISQAVMRRIIAHNDVDTVLTTGKPIIQSTAKDEIQRVADDYGLGIRIRTVQMGAVRPPEELLKAPVEFGGKKIDTVKAAFDEVMNAVERKQGLINEGKQEYNRRITEAGGLVTIKDGMMGIETDENGEPRIVGGTAYQLIQEAEGYRAERINYARGDAQRFLNVFEAYKAEPDITRRQLYLQEMREILKKVRKIIVDSEVPVNLFLEELRK